MKHEKKEGKMMYFVGFSVIVFLVVVCILQSGCATIKGVAHDLSWTAGKIDQSITIPE